MTLQRIIVGVDGSPASDRATLWAARRAEETGAEVVLVLALDIDTQFARDLPPQGLTSWRSEVRRQLRDEWTKHLVDAGVPHRTLTIEAPPAAAILRAAEDEEADLIVIGTHGHGGLRDRLLGSVSYRIIHLARHPVTVIPPDWRGP